MDPDTTILVTIHGSRLYGLDHSDSDTDIFRVVASRKGARVIQRNSLDYREFGLDAFLKSVFNGSHQACEALFSPLAKIHPMYQPMFSGIRVTGEDVFSRYRRVIGMLSQGDAKMRRHAVRLGFCLADLRRAGRFNPVLTTDQRAKVMWLSELYRGQSLYDIAINL